MVSVAVSLGYFETKFIIIKNCVMQFFLFRLSKSYRFCKLTKIHSHKLDVRFRNTIVPLKV